MADDDGAEPRSTYHHGDLRRTMIAAATRIIAEEGVDALTLRVVGQRVGVSRTALYRHFDDKASLLAAVALEGFRLLRQALEAALGAALETSTDPLVSLAVAYVRFGIDHPPHYQTMFGSSFRDKAKYPALVEVGEATFGILVQAITAGQSAGRLVAGNPHAIAQVMWSTVHGIVMLETCGHFQHLPAEAAAGPALASLAASTLLSGLAVRG